MTAPGPPTIQVISGFPVLDQATAIYQGMLRDAGLDAVGARPPEEDLASRSSFHVAVGTDGVVLGVLLARIGSLSELILADAIEAETRLAGPICECPTIAVDRRAMGMGVTELLYRSVYCFARRSGALSLVTALDPLTVEIFRQDYAIDLRALGPLSDRFGGGLVPVGEELEVIEAEVRRRKPEFFSFLTESFTDAERRRFGL